MQPSLPARLWPCPSFCLCVPFLCCFVLCRVKVQLPFDGDGGGDARVSMGVSGLSPPVDKLRVPRGVSGVA